MPYEYRKLSPKEREEIVRYRSERGYPLQAPPHPFRDAGAYLISVSNFEHRPIMSSVKDITEDLIVWVVLPNHYDMLVGVQLLDVISAVLKHLHGATSRESNIEDNLTGKRRVWYKFADTYMRNDAHLRIAFNYIHFNPVKRGCVSDPYDWPWSSLQMYYDDRGENWLHEQCQTYKPPDDFGSGWDDDIKNDYTCPGRRC